MVQKDTREKLIEKIDELLPQLATQKEDGVEALLSCSKGLSHFEIRSYDTYDLYRNIIKIIHTYYEFGDQFSYDFIEGKMQNVFHDILSDRSSLEDRLDKLFSSLRDLKDTESEIFTRIHQIEMDEGKSYEIADCSIQNIPEQERSFETQLAGSGFFDEPVIKTNVHAGDDVRAKEVAIRRFQVTLGVLRLFSGMTPKIDGNLFRNKREIVIHDVDSDSTGFRGETVGDKTVKTLPLDDGVYHYLRQRKVPELSETTEFAEILKHALYWWYSAETSNKDKESLLEYVTVLETILKKKNESGSTTEKIATRGAILLAANADDRKEVYDQLKRIYGVRSNLIHTGRTEDRASDVNHYLDSVRSLARQALSRAILLNERFDGDFQNYVKHLESKKFEASERDNKLYD